VISYNAIAFNKLGVNIAGSSGNVIHHNRFEANDYDSYDDGQNQWDDGAEGNCYLNLSCKDLNNDRVLRRESAGSRGNKRGQSSLSLKYLSIWQAGGL